MPSRKNNWPIAFELVAFGPSCYARALMRSFNTLCSVLFVALWTLRAPAQSTVLTVASNVNISMSAADNAETAIAINPQNPLNLFAEDTWTVVGRYTTNGGLTWNTSDLSALPGSDGDMSCAFDDFGNLFLVQFSPVQSLQIVVGLSTNGGASFSLLYETTTKKNDQPTLVTGPSATPGQGSVWISYTDKNNNQVVQGATVTGFGSVGTFTAAQTVLGGLNGDFGDIAVGPSGQVMIVYQNNTTTEGPDTIHMNLNPNGVGGTFGPQSTPTVTQVGGFASIPAQPLRSIDAEPGLAWDRSGGPFQGRVYLMYTDRPNTSSYDTDILLRYSDNNGTNWSAPVRVNDDPLGNGKSQFLPRIALDQTTGYIAVSFYDCRNSVSNNTTEFWAAVSTNGGASFLPNVKVSAGVSSALATGALGNKFDYGDYSGLTFFGGVFYPCWADNSNSTGDNPDGALNYFDMYTARVTVNTPLVLLNPRSSTNSFVVSTKTTVGKTYILEATATLPSAIWYPVANTVGNGSLLNLTDTNPAAQTFYRARVQ
jgi:hypothetical protein